MTPIRFHYDMIFLSNNKKNRAFIRSSTDENPVFKIYKIKFL